MRDVECVLLSTEMIEDSIGVQKEKIVQIPVPIIKVEDVYASEYYKANEQGRKPSLRLRMSNLNYGNQEELIYGGVTYSVVRAQEVTTDEVVLVCERKIKNVQKD